MTVNATKKPHRIGIQRNTGIFKVAKEGLSEMFELRYGFFQWGWGREEGAMSRENRKFR